ncbi:MAG: type II toxin-antitoxin system PemK/MazF family toxin [Ilumatobacteraceae bacterium]
MVAQGDLWLMEPPNGKRRPVLVVSRNEAIPVLTNLLVAPVTGTIRSIPTCVPVGQGEGIDHDSVATFDNLATVPRSLLTIHLGSLGAGGRALMCAALRAVADC